MGLLLLISGLLGGNEDREVRERDSHGEPWEGRGEETGGKGEQK